MTPSTFDTEFELFVPGRLCLFGEHSDWAGFYRTFNPKIFVGRVIVTGIDQGIYAKVKRSDTFCIRNIIPGEESEYSSDMDIDALNAYANSNCFYSYVAGVVAYMKEKYDVGGIGITITKRDLPIKKGLSSSASICVLVVRAMNLIYNLGLTTEQEAEMAYYGELKTGSRCGRLDFLACAYGKKLIEITFDGLDISCSPIHVKKDLHYVIFDLCSHKDTITILSDLNSCFPFARNSVDSMVQYALGPANLLITKYAKQFIEEGNDVALGNLMGAAQDIFDRNIAIACPKELRAPTLHFLLENTDLMINQHAWIYGAKGVGSQGDGCAQFLVSSKEAQDNLADYVYEHFGFIPYKATITANTESEGLL